MKQVLDQGVPQRYGLDLLKAADQELLQTPVAGDGVAPFAFASLAVFRFGLVRAPALAPLA